ncbi:MAG: hypothetical protein KGI25_08335 [Thaumarchaeota archaeon]|nr:hypothetical protein [Nitrososphaerota archaeon]
MEINTAEHILDTYTLEEIFELNEVTEADVLLFLLKEEYLELPEPLPIDLDNE